MGEPIQEMLTELEKSQYYPVERLRENQSKQLVALIEHSYKNIPYYKRAMKKLGAEPGDIKSVDDLGKLPELTKENIHSNHDELIARDKKRPNSIAKTSGSTGTSLHLPKDKITSTIQRAAMFRGHRWYGVDIGAPEARLWGIPLDFVGKMKTKLTDVILNRFREREYNLYPKTLNHFYQLLKKRRPEYLMGYTSMVYQFALFLQDNGMSAHGLELKMVKLTSETINTYERETINNVFNCPVVSEYGAAETGLISFECPEGNNHLMADCVITEFKKVESMDKEKELYEILVTVPTNYTFPIIRYNLKDLVSIKSGECECGRKLPLVGKVRGRTSDIVITQSGERFHSIVFYYIMKGLQTNGGGVKQFKAIQKATDYIRILVVKDDNFTEKTFNYLNTMFEETFGENMRIEYQLVDVIQREPSGKLRDFVSELNLDKKGKS